MKDALDEIDPTKLGFDVHYSYLNRKIVITVVARDDKTFNILVPEAQKLEDDIKAALKKEQEEAKKAKKVSP